MGGPAWELKIDAERLQETEKNEEEEESEKRRETKCKHMARKGSAKKALKLKGVKNSIWKSIWIDDADPCIFTGRKWPLFTIIRFLRFLEGGR